MAVGDPASPSACEFVVLGNTGNVYKVKLQEVPECNCPDFVRGHLCKHYLFVMLRVLKLADTDPRVWQKALLPSELSNILRQPEVAGEVLASQSVRQRFQELSGKKNTGGLTCCFFNLVKFVSLRHVKDEGTRQCRLW